MKKVIIISGPTSSGKTDLSYTVGRNIPAVLLNSDSRHIYKSLNIIAGKDLPDGSVFQKNTSLSHSEWDVGFYTVEGSKFYLLDIVQPSQTFSVRDYNILVKQVLPAVSHHTTPIFVGGSNFYSTSLLDTFETTVVPPNNQLRTSLSDFSVDQLQQALKEVDIKRFSMMNNSDKNNPRRLVRAIEVGKWKQSNRLPIEEPILSNYSVFNMALTAPLDMLRERIDSRVDSRLSQGAVQEAESLYKHFDDLSQNVRTANGYMQLFEYLSGSITYDEAIQKWKYSEYHNAKKQLTWIHGDSRIRKYSITDPHYVDKVLHDILDFIE